MGKQHELAISENQNEWAASSFTRQISRVFLQALLAGAQTGNQANRTLRGQRSNREHKAVSAPKRG